MLQLSKFKWSLVVMVFHFIVLGYFLAVLPVDAQVPMHWNINNEIDGYWGKIPSLIFGAGMSLGLFLLMYLMPLYSPWYNKYARRFDAFLPPLTLILLLFLALINIYSLWLAYTKVVPGIQFILVLIGLLFIFLGNIMPKTPRNFFIGIKTPWTLANEDVWHRTHRLGGKIFVISGIIMILKSFVWIHNNSFQQLSGAVAMLILLYPLLHSLIIFKEKR